MKLKLIEKKKRTEGVISFIFKPDEDVTWQAGQYFHWVLHHEPTDDRGSDRWFTISSAPYEKVAMITTRITKEKGSSFKNALQDLKIGDEIEESSLEGDFVIDDLKKEYVFLAGGIGITPFHSILKQFDHEGKKIKATLLYANRDEHITFKKELEAFSSKNPGFKIYYIISPKHIDENTIHEFVLDINKPLFYVSGPEPMVESLGQMLKKMGIPENRIKQDFFPNYPTE